LNSDEKRKLKKLLSTKDDYEIEKLDFVLRTFLIFTTQKRKKRSSLLLFTFHLSIFLIGVSAILTYIIYPNAEILKSGGGVIIFFFFVYLFISIEYGNSFFKKYVFPKNIRIETEIGLLSGIFLSILLFIRSIIYYSPTVELYGAINFIFILSRIVIAPILEEILFRFLLTDTLEKVLKKEERIIYILSASIFSISHLPSGIIGFTLYFIAGWVFLYLYKKYKTLYPGMIAHSIANSSIIFI